MILQRGFVVIVSLIYAIIFVNMSIPFLGISGAIGNAMVELILIYIIAGMSGVIIGSIAERIPIPLFGKLLIVVFGVPILWLIISLTILG